MSSISRTSPDPHRLVGMGGPEDVLMAGRIAVREAVLQRIGLLGSSGKATLEIPFRADEKIKPAIYENPRVS